VITTPATPAVALADAAKELREHGFAIVEAASVADTLPTSPTWLESWNQLPPDPHLADGGKYRKNIMGVNPRLVIGGMNNERIRRNKAR